MSPSTPTRRVVLASGAVVGGAVVLFGPGTADAATLTPAQIAAAKRRLNAQGYYCGQATGVVDDLTRCAVMAYQKANRWPADGVLDAAVMQHLTSVRPRPTFLAKGPAVEVDLARQLLRVVVDGAVVATLHASTGDGKQTALGSRTVVGSTPEGRFRLWPDTREDTVTSSLGVMKRPRYFHVAGYAIYGLDGVTKLKHASTHGGVAVHPTALRWLETRGYLPAGRQVIVR